ncbi:reverse transcriptase domain-containing protein [Tanacetum coccineum]|uniref:Reverse transcriptase domain-containing protein n=1 Tax=Tanacetum coccineum TaxID=301880 RepID=A0ABQ4WCY4_9ASTR
MSLELADRSIQYPRGISENMLIKVDKFDLPIDFVILDMPEDSRILIILGRPFLAAARAMIDVFNKKITLKNSKTEEPIRRIDSISTVYRVEQESDSEQERVYAASANDINEKKPKRTSPLIWSMLI